MGRPFLSSRSINLKETPMRLSARQIRSLNSTLARVNGRSIYNHDKPLPPPVPNRSYRFLVVVNPQRS
jgi:hypothetical protein